MTAGTRYPTGAISWRPATSGISEPRASCAGGSITIEYRFEGRFDFPSAIGTLDARNVFKGDWMGTELTYRFRVPVIGFLTVGTQASWDLRAQLEAYYAAPVYAE